MKLLEKCTRKREYHSALHTPSDYLPVTVLHKLADHSSPERSHYSQDYSISSRQQLDIFIQVDWPLWLAQLIAFHFHFKGLALDLDSQQVLTFILTG